MSKNVTLHETEQNSRNFVFQNGEKRVSGFDFGLKQLQNSASCWKPIIFLFQIERWFSR